MQAESPNRPKLRRSRAVVVSVAGKGPLPARLRRVPKDSTVYYCPDCDTRYLGVQRCEGCDRFCRRLGAGGICPCCDEPVALKELAEGVTIMFSD